MNYKVQGAVKKVRKYLVVYLILWVVLNILLVMPVSYSYVEACGSGTFNLNTFMETLFNVIMPFSTFGKTFSSTYFGNYISLTIGFTLIYIILVVIGMIKLAPKNQYSDIEHGSSDWSEHGEQYQILSPKSGIILAEKNYLPLDKMGNVNVLIVGRIRCW